MQTETWFQLVEQQFPQSRDTVDYLRREGEHAVAIGAGLAFGRAGVDARRKRPKRPSAPEGTEAEFLESLGHKRKPVPSKAVKVKPQAKRYQEPR